MIDGYIINDIINHCILRVIKGRKYLVVKK